MKMEVDQDLCISCGSCMEICPEVFDWDDDEKAYVKVDEIPPDQIDQAQEAMDSCPTDAIDEV